MKNIRIVLVVLLIIFIPIMISSQTYVKVRFRTLILGEATYDDAKKYCESQSNIMSTKYLEGYYFNPSDDINRGWYGEPYDNKYKNIDIEKRIKVIKSDITIEKENMSLTMVFFDNIFVFCNISKYSGKKEISDKISEYIITYYSYFYGNPIVEEDIPLKYIWLQGEPATIIFEKLESNWSSYRSTLDIYLYYNKGFSEMKCYYDEQKLKAINSQL